ncbi:TetR/AcrR family transcriptional regulator [Mycobacterium gordonae]|nr:TetR/AcrR family transcriptional regulator [Mycobacterium gordonae]MBI2698427.1 TetR/AcrR family transcriptional regulator [Mycobacterium sp.]MBX9983354.1 TetR/AcrR family transcriptional regulator [Mycobacterium gordonae]MCQ4362325.1 TetR/AcrR family transcriptional regulator [Mycobacterium gordonae]MCV7006164.1 TetR/AcrR family transcriptional regulator [Mycobacterium gordonae]
MSLAMDTKSSDYVVKKRGYEMRARKDAADATHEAILQATIDCFVTEQSVAITLNTIAERAGVTVKTVMRHFGSRESVIASAWARVHEDILIERVPPREDPDRALEVLLEHYERRGDMVLGVLREEDFDPRARLMCDRGRVEHRKWVTEVFSGQLPDDAAERARLVDALVVATDLYTWKLLRRDRKLTTEEVRNRMQFMTNAILAAI